MDRGSERFLRVRVMARYFALQSASARKSLQEERKVKVMSTEAHCPPLEWEDELPHPKTRTAERLRRLGGSCAFFL